MRGETGGRKQGKRVSEVIIGYGRENYIIVEDLESFSITPVKEHATRFDNVKEAEEWLRKLWIEGNILTA